ncbi:hypothetical protein Golob_027794 [Gossypium lobatum]|uniref:Bulb-type lectin domain-containing protein n=1 Tax=Gossypium lobatum TaxID=34289 RepID=A0A7J8NLA6_9ROSI|nr:hypothetical protein [Gossypium lobatum]
MELVLSLCLLSLLASTTGASNVGQDISATPTIFDGAIYFPSRDRYIYAVKASNEGLVWKKKLQQLTGLNSTRVVSNIHPNITVSRTTPVIAHDLLIFGMSGPAFVVAPWEYAGAAIWGSRLSIDIRWNHVYIGTRNLYSKPKNVRDCQERQNNRTYMPSTDECVEPKNHSVSILALDLDTGKVKCFNQLGGYDVWFFACNNVPNPKCPPGPKLDADF